MLVSSDRPMSGMPAHLIVDPDERLIRDRHGRHWSVASRPNHVGSGSIPPTGFILEFSRIERDRRIRCYRTAFVEDPSRRDYLELLEALRNAYVAGLTDDAEMIWRAVAQDDEP